MKCQRFICSFKPRAKHGSHASFPEIVLLHCSLNLNVVVTALQAVPSLPSCCGVLPGAQQCHASVYSINSYIGVYCVHKKRLGMAVSQRLTRTNSLCNWLVLGARWGSSGQGRHYLTLFSDSSPSQRSRSRPAARNAVAAPLSGLIFVPVLHQRYSFPFRFATPELTAVLMCLDEPMTHFRHGR